MKGFNEILGMFSFLFVLALMVFTLNIAAYKAASDKLEDALAASGLAASLVDIRQYGTDHSIVISDAENAFEKYGETLSVNLGLNEGGHAGSGLIEGDVNIVDFRIYNVRGDTVSEIKVSDAGITDLGVKPLGEMRAPNGQIIELTGIYSEISFLLNHRYGRGIIARKSKLTSIDTV